MTISNYDWFSKWWDNTLHSKSVNLIRFKSCTDLLFFNRAARFMHKMCKAKDIQVWNGKQKCIDLTIKKIKKPLQTPANNSKMKRFVFVELLNSTNTFDYIQACNCVLENPHEMKSNNFCHCISFRWCLASTWFDCHELRIKHVLFHFNFGHDRRLISASRPPMHNNYCRGDNSICVFGTNKRKFRISLIPLR